MDDEEIITDLNELSLDLIIGFFSQSMTKKIKKERKRKKKPPWTEENSVPFIFSLQVFWW